MDIYIRQLRKRTMQYVVSVIAYAQHYVRKRHKLRIEEFVTVDRCLLCPNKTISHRMDALGIFEPNRLTIAADARKRRIVPFL